MLDYRPLIPASLQQYYDITCCNKYDESKFSAKMRHGVEMARMSQTVGFIRGAASAIQLTIAAEPTIPLSMMRHMESLDQLIDQLKEAEYKVGELFETLVCFCDECQAKRVPS